MLRELRLRPNADAHSPIEIIKRPAASSAHRSSAQPSLEPCVVHDLASADVDSVIGVTAALSDNVSSQRRF